MSHQSASALTLPSTVGSKEVKTVLGISLPTLIRWIEKGILPKPMRFGKALRWSRASFQAFLKAKEREAVAHGTEAQGQADRHGKAVAQ